MKMVSPLSRANAIISKAQLTVRSKKGPANSAIDIEALLLE